MLVLCSSLDAFPLGASTCKGHGGAERPTHSEIFSQAYLQTTDTSALPSCARSEIWTLRARPTHFNPMLHQQHQDWCQDDDLEHPSADRTRSSSTFVDFFEQTRLHRWHERWSFSTAMTCAGLCSFLSFHDRYRSLSEAWSRASALTLSCVKSRAPVVGRNGSSFFLKIIGSCRKWSIFRLQRGGLVSKLCALQTVRCDRSCCHAAALPLRLQTKKVSNIVASVLSTWST